MLKRCKTPGIDNLTGELFKDGGDSILTWLVRISKIIWETERTPREWSKGVIIPLPKKGDLSHCSNNRGITLLAVASKDFLCTMMLRVSDEIDRRLRENQAGFRRGRSWQEQIFCLRQIIDKCLDENVPLLINFVDFKAAFDSVHRATMWKVLEVYGIPPVNQNPRASTKQLLVQFARKVLSPLGSRLCQA